MRITKKTTVDRIISKVYNDFGLDEIDESVIIEWIGDVLAQLDIHKAYQERVAFLEVKNHEAEIPDDMISLREVSINNNYNPDSENYECKDYCKCDCKEAIGEEESISCEEEVTMFRDCRGRLVIPEGYERVYFTTNFKLSPKNPYIGSTDFYGKNNCFTKIKASDNVYKSLKICDDSSECVKSLYSPNQEEFSVIGNNFRFSFKEGQVVVSYLSQPIDIETGYPLIPDDISIISAITNYILFMYCRKMHIIGRDGYKEKYQEAEKDYNWYLSQAKNKLYGLYGEDEHDKFTESYLKIIPTKYFS